MIVGSGRDVFGRRRRRRQRELAGWLGRYALVERDRPGWSRCRVVDVSTGGAGLVLHGPQVTVGDRLVVDLQLVRSNMEPVTLTGEVRHAGDADDGLRVGIRFVDVGELEGVLLQRLLARQKHDRRHRGVVIPLEPSR
jgi:hypothetical protein